MCFRLQGIGPKPGLGFCWFPSSLCTGAKTLGGSQPSPWLFSLLVFSGSWSTAHIPPWIKMQFRVCCTPSSSAANTDISRDFDVFMVHAPAQHCTHASQMVSTLRSRAPAQHCIHACQMVRTPAHAVSMPGKSTCSRAPAQHCPCSPDGKNTSSRAPAQHCIHARFSSGTGGRC